MVGDCVGEEELELAFRLHRHHPSPQTTLALGSWLAFVDYNARHSINTPEITRAEALHMCIQALKAITDA